MLTGSNRCHRVAETLPHLAMTQAALTASSASLSFT